MARVLLSTACALALLLGARAFEGTVKELPAVDFKDHIEPGFWAVLFYTPGTHIANVNGIVWSKTAKLSHDQGLHYHFGALNAATHPHLAEHFGLKTPANGAYLMHVNEHEQIVKAYVPVYETYQQVSAMYGADFATTATRVLKNVQNAKTKLV